MPLVIIHGDDSAKTRSELSRVIAASKAKGYEDIVYLQGQTLQLTELIQNMESGSFFSEIKRLTVIENIHRMRSKTTLKTILEYLQTDAEPYPCVLWESQELTAAQLKKFPKAKVITANASVLIFKLTDNLKPGAIPGDTINLLQKACQTDSAEMVLIMLARQLRLMIQTFDPAAKLPPWQKGKLVRPAQQFGLDKLIAMHHQLAVIDQKNKSGQLPSDLASELEQWFVGVLV